MDISTRDPSLIVMALWYLTPSGPLWLLSRATKVTRRPRWKARSPCAYPGNFCGRS